jgi:Gpi18-like mannosyltransferase
MCFVDFLWRFKLAEKRCASSNFHLYGLAALLIIYCGTVFIVSLSLSYAGIGTAVLITMFSALLSAVSILILKREGLADSVAGLIPALLPILLSFLLRLFLFDHITLDYKNFLSPWVEAMKSAGGLAALKNPIGNYNIPYLVFLGFISGLPVYDLYLIKLLSVLFDFILALFLMKLVSCFTDSKLKKYICLVVALFLPTPILNGALWGQCDSIYTALAVIGLYYGFKGRSVLSLAFIALSFAFKLQAVFILPVFLLFIISGKIRFRYIPVFPAVYFLAVSPAIIAGRPVLDTLTIYFSELGTVGSGLNYNSPSIFSLFKNVGNPNLASRLGIFAAFFLCAAVFTAALLMRQRITDGTLISAALIFAVGIPLLLPHMHDRYFFIADVLSLAFAVIFPAFSYTVPLCSFASLLGYHAYLKMRYFLPMSWGFFCLLFVLVSIAYFFIKSINKNQHGKGAFDSPA